MSGNNYNYVSAQSLNLPILTADKGFSVIREVDIFILEI